MAALKTLGRKRKKYRRGSTGESGPLQHPPDTATDAHGYTPLHRAAATGRMDPVRAELRHCCASKVGEEATSARCRGAALAAQTTTGRTPLSVAIKSGNAAVVALLLHHKASLHEPSGQPLPLHAAVRNRSVPTALVRMLLAAGADPDACVPGTVDDMPALHVLLRVRSRRQYKERHMRTHDGPETLAPLVTLLLRASSAETVGALQPVTRQSLLWATLAHADPVALLRPLVAHGLRLDHTDHKGETVLWAAIRTKNARVVGWIARESLLAAQRAGGGRPVFSHDGTTPMQLAVALGWPAGVRCLRLLGFGAVGTNWAHEAECYGHAALAQWWRATAGWTRLQLLCEAHETAQVRAELRSATGPWTLACLVGERPQWADGYRAPRALSPLECASLARPEWPLALGLDMRLQRVMEQAAAPWTLAARDLFPASFRRVAQWLVGPSAVCVEEESTEDASSGARPWKAVGVLVLAYAARDWFEEAPVLGH